MLAEEKASAVSAHQLRLWIELAWQLKDSPRHLSQHVGGFVLTEGRLTSGAGGACDHGETLRHSMGQG